MCSKTLILALVILTNELHRNSVWKWNQREETILVWMCKLLFYLSLKMCSWMQFLYSLYKYMLSIIDFHSLMKMLPINIQAIQGPAKWCRFNTFKVDSIENGKLFWIGDGLHLNFLKLTSTSCKLQSWIFTWRLEKCWRHSQLCWICCHLFPFRGWIF